MNLYDDLGRIKGGLGDSGALGTVYNALLREVKSQHEGDPVLVAMEPVGFTSTGQTAGSAEALRAQVGQLIAIIGE